MSAARLGTLWPVRLQSYELVVETKLPIVIASGYINYSMARKASVL